MKELETAEVSFTTPPALTPASPSVSSLGDSSFSGNSLQAQWRADIKIFVSTFLTIFLAELGDKTQMTILLMSAESQSPWTVFAGASLALVLTSLLGVLVGRWLSQRVSPQTLERAVGVLLLIISILLVWDVVQA
jgi:putative Ca2+/H+ antiporter (TMEM165/GDT1 family)